MFLNRRHFLLLTTGFVAGCQSADESVLAGSKDPVPVNAGPSSRYGKDGVYSDFRSRGFFLVRRGEKLFALSSVCTHRDCKLIAEPDRTFYCKCHGSTFDPDGKVTKGPARRDLPVFAVFTNDKDELVVAVSGK